MSWEICRQRRSVVEHATSLFRSAVMRGPLPAFSTPGSEQVGPTVRSPRVLTPGLVAGFVAIVVVLIATPFVGLAKLQTVYATSEAVAHIHGVKCALNHLLAPMIDAVTTRRGFVMTVRC